MSDKIMLANPPDAQIYIQIVVEGTGALDRRSVADAVATAARTCHGSRLTRRGERWIDSGRPPETREADGDRIDRSTFRDASALNRPLTGDGEGPMSEVVLLTGARPALVFRVHHAVMDGKGALLWAREVFRALRGEPASGVDSRTTVRDVRHLHGRRSGPPAARPTAPPPLRGQAALGARGYFFLRRTVNGQHPAVVAKIAVTLTELCELGTATFIVPVDLRRHLTGVDSTAQLSMSMTLPVPRGASWQRVQEMLLTRLRDKQDLAEMPPPMLQGAMDLVPLRVWRTLLSIVDTRSARSRSSLPAFTLTHLGRVELADYSTEKFAATTVYSLPVCGLMITPVITIVEVEGRTEIIISGDDMPGLAERATKLLDGIVCALSPAEAELRGPVTAVDDETLVSLFAGQVRKTPDAIALVERDSTLTYAELDRRADAVANTLLARGIGAGDVVGLIADRAIHTVAGLWGILRAGAAYLPLDPNHPDSWLADLLDASGSAACLLATAHDQRPCVPEGCVRIVIEDCQVPAAPMSTVSVAPEDLAYVIYTSGSTGRPKGVEVEHRNVVNYVHWAIREYRVDATSRFPLFTSLAFDLPITAILVPLLAGGSVALIDEDLNHVSLSRMLRDSGVNSVKLTPSHLDLITRLGITAPQVRIAIVGGESLPSRVAAAAKKAFGPDCRIVNEYGPTEATVGCVIHEYDPGTDVDAAVPIGRSVDNTTVLLLNECRAAVPAGEAGAMYVAGAQVARGYRGRPDLNDQLFVRLADGSRAYATGDLARVLPSGELAYLGRRDEQIKVLGYRVEPAEIERALETHPAVTRAAVVGLARPGESTKTPCAYVVGADDVTAADLHAHLAALVPKHMIPSVILPVADLPRAASGKLDLRALPDPFATSAENHGQNRKARDRIESAIAGIWARTLGMSTSDISPDNDFYSLGGTSLNLMIMVASVCEEVGGGSEIMTAFSHIIEDPTVDRIAALVRSEAGKAPFGRGAADLGVSRFHW
ncbi:MAG TPA: non-ribosomal peptide synthetase [Pseudonocardiaceae bacterium]|jgi:amino acid adenylation domain-containing protein|nr:non-ribosomal peptide synthetase [Pseudonocardiaceae bacterium]